MKLATTIKRWFARANTYFVANWRVVPYQPILFLFAFIGAVLALTVDISHPTFLQDYVFTLWITLSVICPPMALVAWWLIRYRSGRARYIGLCIRLGADAGQLASVSAFLAIIAPDMDPVAVELYAAELLAAAWWFIVLLLIRDIWKLVLTERVATVLHSQTSP